MKKQITAVVMALCSLAAAAKPTIDAVVAECERQMAAGTCQALRDPGTYTAEELNRTMLFVGYGRVKFSAYLAVRGAGDIRMCQVVREACTSDDKSERCTVGYGLWGN
jgi:hypothetical protein